MQTPSTDPVINITSRTVLVVGANRITIEPSAPEAGTRAAPPVPATGYGVRPVDWKIAEAEMQSKVDMPFEPPAAALPRKSECHQFAPRVGGSFHAVGGGEVEIKRVVGKHGGMWCVVDPRGRPVRVRRLGLNWSALPPDLTTPACGNLILHNGEISVVKEVLGEVDIGGWGVRNFKGAQHHVVHGEGEYWISLATGNLV